MPEEPTQAARFGKARTARSLSLLEDYVELIADLLASHGEARTTDVAKRLGVAHPAAIKTIGRLKREGLVTALRTFSRLLEAPEGFGPLFVARRRWLIEFRDG